MSLSLFFLHCNRSWARLKVVLKLSVALPVEANKELRIEAPPVVEAESSVIIRSSCCYWRHKSPWICIWRSYQGWWWNFPSSTSKQSKQAKKRRSLPNLLVFHFIHSPFIFIHVHADLRDLVANLLLILFMCLFMFMAPPPAAAALFLSPPKKIQRKMIGLYPLRDLKEARAAKQLWWQIL